MANSYANYYGFSRTFFYPDGKLTCKLLGLQKNCNPDGKSYANYVVWPHQYMYSTVNLLYKHQFPKITKVKQPKSAAGTWMGDRSSADVGAVKTGPQTSWGERKTFIFSLFIFCFFMFCVFYFETNPKLNVAKH